MLICLFTSLGCGGSAGTSAFPGMQKPVAGMQAPGTSLKADAATATPTSGMTETGTVRAINTYGTSSGNLLVLIYRGVPYGAINCFAPNSSSFHVGDLVTCQGTYNKNAAGHQWISASNLALQGSASPLPSAGPTVAPTPAPTGAPTPVPTSVPTPTPTATGIFHIALTHVLTAAWVAGYKGTTLPPAQVAPYINWAANPSEANAPAVKAAGMKIYVYTDPNRQYSCSGCSWSYPSVVANPSVIAKTCSGANITLSSGAGYLTDPRVPLMSTLWQQNVAHEKSITATTWDAFFEDDTDDVLYTDIGTARPCNYTQSGWLAAAQAEAAAQNVPIIFNGLSIGTSELAMADVANVIGGMYEGCYTDGSGSWNAEETIELGMAARNKTFWCLGTDRNSASGAQASRMYAYTSFLLTYSLSTSLFETEYVTPSNFPVMPESQLVPENPLVPTPSSVASLLTSTGLYGREYASCYLKGDLVGPCAVLVNPGSSSLNNPYGAKYQHSLAMNGGGIIEGGTVSINAAAAPASVGAGSGAILFQ